MISDNIKKLYFDRGLSAREVGERLGITTWQVIRIMKKGHLPRRTSAETQKIQFHKKPLSFNKKTKTSSKEQMLYYAGLLLYWCEGVKFGGHVVDFANSDDQMVIIFLSMLRQIYRVTEERLRVLLYCYANQNVPLLLKHWSRLLIIPTTQFIKPYVREDFNEKKLNKMPYGLVHIRYNDKRLFMQIQQDIGIISAKLLKC